MPCPTVSSPRHTVRFASLTWMPSACQIEDLERQVSVVSAEPFDSARVARYAQGDAETESNGSRMGSNVSAETIAPNVGRADSARRGRQRSACPTVLNTQKRTNSSFFYNPCPKGTPSQSPQETISLTRSVNITAACVAISHGVKRRISLPFRTPPVSFADSPLKEGAKMRETLPYSDDSCLHKKKPSGTHHAPRSVDHPWL